MLQTWPKSNPLWLYSGSDKQIQGIRSDRVPEEPWTEVPGHCIGGSIQDYLQEKEMQKAKMVVEALQIAVKRREAKGKGEKKR